MKLSSASTMTMAESLLFHSDMAILEDGEGPRWLFDYDRFKTDPSPDILLLGAWRHPNTGNNLVGGINTHYLDKNQTDALARALPEIMKAGNLKSRYWTGRKLVPDVFTKYYRTYNSDHIRGVKQDVMYPKYGFLKTAQNWLKKNLGGIFKSKKQKELDAQPQYPTDLSTMQNTLSQTVSNLQGQPAAGTTPAVKGKRAQPDTPEMQRAREAYQQFQRDKTARELGIQDTEDDILQTSYDDYIDAATKPEQPPRQKLNPKQELEQERIDNQEELNDPKNDIDLDENITYYSPMAGKIITEATSIRKLRSTISESKLMHRLLQLRTKLARAAQFVYDECDSNVMATTNEIFDYNISQLIAEALGDVLSRNNIRFEVNNDGDHTSLIAYGAVDAFTVDIPPSRYEQNMGFSWAKLPEVEFSPRDVVILRTIRPDRLND